MGQQPLTPLKTDEKGLGTYDITGLRLFLTGPMLSTLRKEDGNITTQSTRSRKNVMHMAFIGSSVEVAVRTFYIVLIKQ